MNQCDERLIQLELELAELRGRCELLCAQNTGLMKKAIDLADVKIELEDKNYELEEIKDELEHRVQERTQELKNSLVMLEQLNLRESLLRDMGMLLQVCRHLQESFTIIAKFANQFFPGYSGALCLFDASIKGLKVMVTWGSLEGLKEEFAQDECWALRLGKTFATGGEDGQLLCNHVFARQRIGYTCIPLIAQGEMMGLLHFQAPQTESNEMIANQMFLNSFTDYLGLALANLKLQDRLREQSLRDPLTNLPNRRFLEEYFDQEKLMAKRQGSQLSLIMVDVDHFKNFNDTYGHDAGDLLLQELGRCLQSTCRESDVVCRFGGEEFVILLPSCTHEDAATKAELICAEIRRLRIPYNKEVLSVTVSMGVASYPIHGANLDDVVKAADNALYEAKKQGRDRVVKAPVLKASTLASWEEENNSYSGDNNASCSGAGFILGT